MKVTKKTAKERLEYLRGELRDGSMSYGELAELVSLVKYIQPDDPELLEAAGVPEEEYLKNLMRAGGKL